MLNIKLLFTTLLLLTILTPQSRLNAQDNILLGGDRDSHGCIGSAGYQWCELLMKCIRIFEEGVQLTNEIDPNATSASYAVFNADKSKVQLFLPGYDSEPIILKKKRCGKVWQNEIFRLYTKKGKLWLKSNGKVIYRQTEISVAGGVNIF